MNNKSIKQLQEHIRKYFCHYKDIDEASEYAAIDIAEFYKRQTCSNCKHFKYDGTIAQYTSSGSVEHKVYKCLLKEGRLRITDDLGLKCDEWGAKDE